MINIRTLNDPHEESRISDQTFYNGPPGRQSIMRYDSENHAAQPFASRIKVEDTPNSSESGLQEVHAGESPVVDIIFVHGLSSNTSKTWTANTTDGRKIFAPKDLLPTQISNARIVTWDYDAAVDASLNLESISGHANSLLGDIAANRDAEGISPDRPIIFAGHNIGGIIIKKALQRAKLYDCETIEGRNMHSIFACTIGIVFFGTPHRGVQGAEDDVVPIWKKIVQEVSPDRYHKTPHLINIMQPGSPFLDDQRKEFSLVSSHVKIVCVYERQDQNTAVTKFSAILDGQNVTEIAVNADHQHMCAFTSAKEAGWLRIMAQIRNWVRDRPQPSPQTTGSTTFPQHVLSWIKYPFS